jgi:hypothetical protein
MQIFQFLAVLKVCIGMPGLAWFMGGGIPPALAAADLEGSTADRAPHPSSGQRM